MKFLLLITTLICSLSGYTTVVTQTYFDHKQAHEITWNFAKPVKGWGTNAIDQIVINCDQPTPAYTLHWINAHSLKMSFEENLVPGMKCQGHLNLSSHKEPFNFKVPRLTITEIYPYVLDSIEEDATIILNLDGPIKPELIANNAFIEVEGLSEKIEFDAVTGELRENAIKATYMPQGQGTIVLKARRMLPTEKKIVFKVNSVYTNEFKKEGRVRPPFTVHMSCQRSREDAPCSPLGTIDLEFSNQVSSQQLKNARLIHKKTMYRPKLSKGSTSESMISFDAKILPNAVYTITLPEGMTDENGRPLTNPKKFPLQFKTADYPPLAKFSGAFGVLEAKTESILPVSIRNIEKDVRLVKNSAVIKLSNPTLVMQWKEAVEKRQDQWGQEDLRSKSVFNGSKIQTKSETISYTLGKNDIEVIGLPLKEKGLHIVELHSPALASSLLNNQKNFFISTAVLVTDLVAHLKISERNSLVWVTSLQDGKVVSDAEVSLYNCKGELLEKGRTSTKGTVYFKKVSKQQKNCSGKVNGFNYQIMAVATKGDDATFTLSSWDRGIEPWRFSISSNYNESLERAHTVFDRPIYKQGEKIQMLHILRHQGDSGLVIPKSKYSHIKVQHYESDKVWDIPITWKEVGISSSSFEIPENAPQGYYQVSLINLGAKKNETSRRIPAGFFMVDQYRVPLMISEFQFKDNRSNFLQGEEMNLVGHLKYLAGGAASDLGITLRTELTPITYASFEKYEAFSFNFGDPGQEESDSGTILEKVKTKSDQNGDFTFKLSSSHKSQKPQSVNAEIEYLDPNGVFQTNSASSKIYPFETLIGIKSPENMRLNKELKFHIQAIDLKEKPRGNVAFTGELYEIIYTSVRKKILGGIYSYENTKQIKHTGTVCGGKTKVDGSAFCSFEIKSGGTYQLQIVAGISKSLTTMYLYDNDSWNSQDFHDRMDMLANKKEYQPGETAVFELKAPFETGTVLVTKENSGIKKSFVTTYERKNPFIKVPVEKDDFPNTYVSALLVRGRLSEEQATGMVDLARPAYRMGLTEIQVIHNEQRLKIEITPDKSKYQVRDRVKLKIKVTDMNGSPYPKGKVIISVFDEGLSLIRTQKSFDVEKSLLAPFGHQVETATAQGQVIGKRHFGLKAKPHGGGGGKDLRPRELFDTLVYWNPVIALNNKGEATVDFNLNDSLTSFKIYGLVYGESKFGSTNTRIVATQDIMTFVGTSPVIRTQDHFFAHYTLKNITSFNKALKATVTLNGKSLYDQEVKLNAGASTIIKIPVKPFTTPGEALYHLSLKEGTKRVDEIKTLQKVIPLLTPKVLFSDFKEVKNDLTIPGNNTVKSLSGVELLLSQSLVPGPDDMRSFMRNYHYHCLEQKLARAVIMEDTNLVKKINLELNSYIDDQGFLKFYPGATGDGTVELTAHFLEVSHWAGLTFNETKKLEEALAKFINGQIKSRHESENSRFLEFKLRGAAVLKLRSSLVFVPGWTKDISPPRDTDSLMTLLDKWVLFYPQSESINAQNFIRTKLKVDGQQITLTSLNDNSHSFFLMSDTTIFARFLLLEKTKALKTDFDDFYMANEGKFIRGFLAHQKNGSFVDTVSNTYAYLLQKKWPSSKVTGSTSIANRTTKWNNNEASPLILTQSEATHDQRLLHNGKGSPWANIRYLAYPDSTKSTFQGIELSQSVDSFSYKVQDRIKITIQINIKSDVLLPGIRVPLPPGTSILSTTTSENAGLNYEEKSEHEWRGYFYNLPKGDHKIELSLRLNQQGDFEIPGTRVEALYSPEVFGELPYWKMQIAE